MRGRSAASASAQIDAVEVTDSFRRRIYVAPYGLYLTLDAGQFERVEVDPSSGAARVTLAPAPEAMPRANLRVEQPAQMPGVGAYAPVSSSESERGAIIVPLGRRRRWWSCATKTLDCRSRLDAAMIRPTSSRIRTAVLAGTVFVMVGTSVPRVPRSWLDYRPLPLLSRVEQPATWGTDTIADVYAARVVLNAPSDMYTRARLPQAPLEAATWTPEASAPYPPAMLLAITGLHAAGEWLGVGYYGMVLACAVFFLGASLLYFLRTRWYLFPVLYLNFAYFSERFVSVQDGSYLIMLTVVMTALWLARAQRPGSHALMALATVMKLSPIYYMRNVGRMSRSSALLVVGILVAGLVLPYFVWDNYLYIYAFGYGLRGEWDDALGALAAAGFFAILLAYVESRRGFDLEDRIGWGLVPAALFLALKLNAPRHLLIVLLVPDKRGLRNVAVAAGLALHALAPSVVRFGSVGPIVAALLVLGLIGHLRQVDGATLRADLRHPLATLRSVLRT